MRGRTLNDSFVILDEAQNTTPEQMKMFLTRLGFNSKMVITGDITQVDLQVGTSGLRTAAQALNNIDDMHFATLTSADVVRHSLVAKIVDAYSKFEQKANAKKATNNSALAKARGNR
jgi:phosphate starvation-inducible PhoH-like protein